MRFLLISGIYFPDIGGPATYIPRLASEIVKRGHEVSVVSLTDNIETKRPYEPWSTKFIPRMINKLQRTYKLIKLIRSEAKKSDYVFANGLFVETALALYGLNRNSTAKIVGDPVWERLMNKRRTQLSLDEFNSNFTGVTSQLQRKALNFAISKFDKITTPSQNLSKNITNWGVKRKIHVIANGVFCLDLGESQYEYDVVSLARLVSWKRINILIEACAVAGLRLAIAGEGPEKEQLEKLVIESNCDAHFLGQINREESISLIRNSSIFALLSTYEGLSFALVEAMMLAKKILVSDSPGNLEVIDAGKDGLVAKDLSIFAVAEQLKFLHTGNDLAVNFGKSAREKARQSFCEEEQLSKMIELILRQP